LAQPEVPAVLAPGRESPTFAGLWRQMEYVAGAIGGPAGITAVILPNGPELLTALLGILLAGAAAPLNPDLTEAELRRQVAFLRPRTAVLGSDQSASVEALVRSLGIRVLRAEQDESESAGVFALREVWRPVSPQPLRSLPPDTRLLLHTSGTGGEPKVAPLSEANLRASFASQHRSFALTAADRFLCLAPLFHLHGFGSAAAQLTAGGSVVCPQGFDPQAFPEWLRQFRPTWYTGGPALHHAVASLVATGAELPRESLRFVRSSSAALESGVQAELERALGVPFIDSYGLTEAGTVAAIPLPPAKGKPGSAGLSAGAEIGIFGPDACPLPVGAEGEIAVRGPNVIGGYLDDPAANRDSFHDGWFLTGDLGRLDADGYLFVTGRLKDVINRGGAKVMPAEIDAALLAHPAVAEAAAFGVPHARLGEEVEAAVVPRDGAALTESELRAYAAGRLAGFKVPRRIHFTAAIPRTSTGKPKRAALTISFARSSDNAVPDRTGLARPLSPEQARIAAIWSRVLGCGEILAEDELPMLGGDSLSAAVILAEVQAEFGIAGSLAGFFDRPTVEHLAQLVAQLVALPLTSGHRGPGSRAVIHLGGEGPEDPVFCIPATLGSPYYLRHLAARMDRRPFFAVVPPRRSGDPAELTVEELAREVIAGIRAVHPQGPCILAGHCFGGVVAFEAVRQMRPANGDVPLLVLLDTPTPGYPKVLPRWQRYPEAAWRLARREGARALMREAAAHIRALRRGRHGRRRTTTPGNDEAAVIGRAMHGYLPQPLDRPIVQVLSSELQRNTRVLEDERLGWRDFARAGFSVVDAPGDHHTFLLPPQVDELARRLEAVLMARR
jgi:acyl-CoA synthetase (AMP-forming)/AMP-acid ligase II/thioesterase domain-containing protein/acyl carrier protein